VTKTKPRLPEKVGVPLTTQRVGSEIPVISAGVSTRRVGAHGAFTWGVLDCPLEGDCIGFDGISATNACAMNATVFASHITAGSRQVYRGRDRQNGRDLSVAASTNRQLTR